MNRRIKRIIIFTLLIFVIGVFVWFFLFLSQNERDDLLNGKNNLFPFGKIETSNINSSNTGQESSETSETQETISNIPERIPEKKLRQISDFPTSGFAAFSRVEEQTLNSNEIDEDGVVTTTKEIIQTESQYVRYSNISDSSVSETKISPYSTSSEKLIDNYIPNTERVIFSNDGNYVLFQFWDDYDETIETYLGGISKIRLDIDECPFDFKQVVELDSIGDHVADLHVFLNRNPRTTIAPSGINSPGNEGSKALITTVTAIKNFQSLNGLDIDGVTGPATRAKMIEVCDEQQKITAEKEFAQLDKKYEMSGIFLPDGIISASMSPTNIDLFYLQHQAHGTIGVKESLLTGSKETIFTTPLKELYTQWNNKDFIEISTKPSYQAPGYSYSMDVESGDFHKSLTEEYGMTVLPSRDNKNIFVSKIDNNKVTNTIFSREENKQGLISIKTFADKCTWSYNNIDLYCAVPENLRFADKYPDSWYQGRELYSDSLYQINTETGRKTLISALPYEYSQNIDVSNIRIDPKGEYLYFIDKGTEYLWSYRLLEI